MKIVKIALIILGLLLAAALIAAGAYVYNNLNYYKAPIERTMKAGFLEKQTTLPDGTVLNYGEGPNNGPALFLIHGQQGNWLDYAAVLPELSKTYHIFAVDVHGHGGSSTNPEKYRADLIGEDLVWFMDNVIQEPAVVSGHSSGALLTAWLAANSPENVRGIVLEDPPLFTTEAGQYENTFAWIDTFSTIHNFLNQDEESDYPLYYLKNCAWLKFFGEDARQMIIHYAIDWRKKNPDGPLEFFFLPPSVTGIFRFAETYDPRFGDTFYDASWNENFDHAEALARIHTPSILIHTRWSYDENGVLFSAMDGDDAERAHQLIAGNELINIDCGHNMHYERPKEFIKILVGFLDKIQ